VKARVLGIDFGEKKVGIAITDELQLTARELKTVSSSEVFDAIEELLTKYKISDIVVGNPLNYTDRENKTHKLVMEFVRSLSSFLKERKVNVNIFLVDERDSTKVAESYLIYFSKKKRMKLRKNIDASSAKEILLRFLTEKERKIE